MKLKVALWALFFWLILGGIYMLSLYLDAARYQTGFQLTASMMLTTLLVYAVWSGLTTVLYFFLKKPVEAGKIWSCVLVFFIGLVVALLLITVVDNVVYAAFEQQGWPVWGDVWKNTRYVSVFFNVILYVLVFITCGGFIYQQYSQEMKLNTIELSRQKSATEFKLLDMKMQALQSQLSPHFLFNCLNAISALTRMAEKTQVIKAIARLGDLLRYAISASKRAFISLNDELAFIENYVSLQKLRLGDSFEFKLICDKTTESYVCPPFILHTLVENAIAHGASDQKRFMVTVDISLFDEQLIFSVSNSTADDALHKTSNGLGIALENLNSRLKMLYGEAYSITSEQQTMHFKAVVKIPKDEDSDGRIHAVEQGVFDE